MMFRAIQIGILSLAVWSAATAQQQAFPHEALPHNFTLEKAVPYGCLFAVPGALALPEQAPAFDEVVTFVGPLNTPLPVRLRGWRVGCHEPGRSAIVLDIVFQDGEFTSFVSPSVSLRDASSDGAPAEAALSEFNVPFSFDNARLGMVADTGGATFVVDVLLDDMTAGQYNGELVMSVVWNDQEPVEFTIPAFVPSEDPPQFEAPPLTGRHSGQWVVDGLSRQGLSLHIGEVGDRNFIFAVMFTYLDGVPVWLTGNSDFEPGANRVMLEMRMLDGGRFFTDMADEAPSDTIDDEILGTIQLGALDCNQLSATVDFTQSGFGTAELELERLINIAGYTCDQTR